MGRSYKLQPTETQMKKVFIDTNVFIIHLRYKRDKNYKINKEFLKLVLSVKVKGYISIYNLLETAGILSFNLNSKQIKELFISFPNIFNVEVIFPQKTENTLLYINIEDILKQIYKKMALLDAVILDLFEKSNVETFITWNAKDFKDKIKKKILTPREFLEKV